MFMIDTSPFILPFETVVDIFVLVKPFTWLVWVCSILAPPVYWIVMGLADLIFDGTTLWDHWEFLLDFIWRHLLKQPHKLSHKLSVVNKYNTILTMNWVIGAFVITTLYGGKVLEIFTVHVISEGHF